jgi:hypothetical protein
MTPRFRSIPLLSVAPVALICATLAVAAPTASQSSSHAPRLNARQLAFHDGMRKLWEDHITWTRLAIVSFAAGLPDLQATEQRLLRNQADIGNAVKPYYGKAAGNKLTALLKAHINAAVGVLKAAQTGDARSVAKAKAAFFANGNQVAAFLHSANPRHWSLPAMRTMMRIHLNQVIALAVDQLDGHYAAAIRLYGVYIDHILDMADMLSTGIIQQFPSRF